MDHDPQKRFENLFEKLAPWQREWVTCRAAMRVLPIFGVCSHFDFWQAPATNLKAIEIAIWRASRRGIDDHVAEIDSLISDAVHFGIEAYSALISTEMHGESAPYASSLALCAAYLSPQFARPSYDFTERPKIDLHRANSLNQASAFVAREAAFASATHDTKVLMPSRLKTPAEDLWTHFFERPLWRPLNQMPQFMSLIVGRFEAALKKLGNADLAYHYLTRCEKGTDVDEIRHWLTMEQQPSSFRLGESDDGIYADGSESSVTIPDVNNWWIDLLYRLELDDLGRTRVSVEPSLGTFEGAVRRSLEGESAAAASGLSKGARSSQPSSESLSKEPVRASNRPVRASDVAAVAERLESQYGHLPAPPPLWRAWFQAVHGDRLRKIQDHFAREAD